MRPIRSLAFLALVLGLAGPAGAQAELQSYRAICDASAAVALGSRHFVVGDDEIDSLAIYQWGNPDPVRRVDLVDFLGSRNKKGRLKEADIEGAARVGSRIYWIASHGRDGGGEFEPTRHRFFATEEVAGPGLEPVGRPYTSLLEDMLKDIRLAPLGLAAASDHAPEAPDGLSIEGLAAMPDGGLLVGFRNPRPGGKAVLVPFANPAAVIERGEQARFGEPILLDLEGRGIRSIERTGDAYLVVAGPFGDEATGPAATFALYRWAGGPAAPEKLDVPLAGRPEALFDAGGGRIALLSDDGDERVGNARCKSKDTPLPQKSFRAMTIPR